MVCTTLRWSEVDSNYQYRADDAAGKSADLEVRSRWRKPASKSSPDLRSRPLAFGPMIGKSRADARKILERLRLLERASIASIRMSTVACHRVNRQRTGVQAQLHRRDRRDAAGGMAMAQLRLAEPGLSPLPPPRSTARVLGGGLGLPFRPAGDGQQ